MEQSTKVKVEEKYNSTNNITGRATLIVHTEEPTEAYIPENLLAA
jgi:hypothetical protein